MAPCNNCDREGGEAALSPVRALSSSDGGSTSSSSPVPSRRGGQGGFAAPQASSPLASRKVLDALPFTGRELVRVLRGVEAALAVVNAFGGVTLHIPTSRSEAAIAAHPLRRVLSAQQMLRMVGHYGGTELYIPRCARALLRVRNAAIVETFSACAARGESSGSLVRRLAREHGLSDRWIWSLLKKSE